MSLDFSPFDTNSPRFLVMFRIKRNVPVYPLIYGSAVFSCVRRKSRSTTRIEPLHQSVFLFEQHAFIK